MGFFRNCPREKHSTCLLMFTQSFNIYCYRAIDFEYNAPIYPSSPTPGAKTPLCYSVRSDSMQDHASGQRLRWVCQKSCGLQTGCQIPEVKIPWRLVTNYTTNAHSLSLYQRKRWCFLLLKSESFCFSLCSNIRTRCRLQEGKLTCGDFRLDVTHWVISRPSDWEKRCGENSKILCF